MPILEMNKPRIQKVEYSNSPKITQPLSTDTQPESWSPAPNKMYYLFVFTSSLSRGIIFPSLSSLVFD